MISTCVIHEALLYYFLVLFLFFSAMLAICIIRQRLNNWHVQRPRTFRCTKCNMAYIVGRFDDNPLCICPRCKNQDPNPKHKTLL